MCVRSNRRDNASGLCSQRVGQGDGQSRHSLAHVDIKMVYANIVDFDQHLAWRWFGCCKVAVRQNLQSAKRVDLNGFHVSYRAA